MSRSATPVTLELRGSRWHCAAIAGATLLAIVAVHLAGVSLALAIALDALLLALGGAGLLRVLRWHGTRIVVFEDQPARLRDTYGAELEAALVDATLLGPLIALHLEPARGRAIHLALFPDSADAQDLRRLRVLLRHGIRFGAKEPPIQ